MKRTSPKSMVGEEEHGTFITTKSVPLGMQLI